VPKGILRSVYLSGIFGWIMVCSFVLALPSVSEGAAQGGNIFFWLMDKVIPTWLKLPLEIGIVLANYVCGLACLTSTSRMMFAFSRDGGLPGSRWLRKVSPTHGVPVIAIWAGAAFTVACTLYTPAYSTLTTACVIFLYISYVMPTAAGIFAYGKTWKTMGPFDLGGPLYRLIGVIAVLGVAILIIAGVQPPNDAALPVTAITIVLLVLTWYGGIRKAFAGTPRPAQAEVDASGEAAAAA
jgi:amino acid transporter